MSAGTTMIIVGLLGLLVGMLLVAVFAGPIIDNFATAGGNANLPSFSGGKSFNDMFPLFYYIFSLTVILGSVTAAGLGIARLHSGG